MHIASANNGIGIRPLFHAPRLAAVLRPLSTSLHTHDNRCVQTSRALDDAHVHVTGLLHRRDPRKLASRRLAALPALADPSLDPWLRGHGDH